MTSTQADLAQRHKRLALEIARLRAGVESEGLDQDLALLGAWEETIDEAKVLAEGQVRIPIIAQVGRGKSTLIAAAASLRLDVSSSKPERWSVLPVDRGRTTLGEVVLAFEDRSDVEVEVEGWTREDLERELRLVAEDAWDQVHRPPDTQVRGAVGNELKALFQRWISPDPREEEDVESAFERLAHTFPADRAAFVTVVAERACLSGRLSSASRSFSDSSDGRTELKTFLLDLMQGRVGNVSAPSRTTLRLPLRHAPEGVDELIDTQGLEANAQGILIEARGDILAHLESPSTPLVFCSAFEDAPDVVSQALLQRTFAARQGQSAEGVTSMGGVTLIIVDREDPTDDPMTSAKARKRRLRECQEQLRRFLAEHADQVKVDIIDAKSEAERLRGVLAALATEAREARLAVWERRLGEAERALEPLLNNDRAWRARLRTLDLRLRWEWEAGLAQAMSADLHSLELLALAINRRESKHIEHWSHLNAAARRRGHYRKLDLSAVAGRLSAEHRVGPLRGAVGSVYLALETRRIDCPDPRERAHAQMRLSRMWGLVSREEAHLRDTTTAAVRAFFESDRASSLWTSARRRWGEGPGYVEDFADMVRAEVPRTPWLGPPPRALPSIRDILSPQPAQLLVQRVMLDNFRAFTHLDLPIEALTTIVGNNGAGKTSTLDAIASLLSPLVSTLTGGVVSPLVHRDVRVESFEGPEAPLVAPPEPLNLRVDVEFEGTQLHWSRRAALDPMALREEEHWDDLATLAEGVRGELNKPSNRQLPVIACYRLERRAMPVGPVDTDLVVKDARLDGYRGCLAAGMDFQYLVQWVRKHTFAALQRKRPSRLLEAIQRAVSACVPGLRGFSYDIASEELMVFMDDGRAFPLAVLSSGYQSIISLVADLAWRASVLNPQLFELAPELTEGVVLIDEIDLHLHPRWQRRVISDLRRAFPRIQFIVTTHSPQVIASVDPRTIRILHPDGEVGQVEHSRGVDTNTLLREVFDDDGFPRETLEMIGRIRTSIAAGATEKATGLVDALERRLGGMASVVRTLRWELAEAALGEE